MKMSESVKELAGALVAVQKEIVPLKRDKTNPFFNSSYVGLESVMPEALRILNGHDIALTQTPGTAEDGSSTLTTTLLHSSGEWMTDTQPLLLSKPDPQGQGSAITYARRYGVMSALGIVAEEDDDGNKAAPRQQSRPAPPKAVRTAPDPRQNGQQAAKQPPAKPTAAENNKKAQALLEEAAKAINAEYTLADAITLLMGKPPEKGKHPLTAWLADTKPLTVIEAATVGARCLDQMHEELKKNGGSVADAREVVGPLGQLAEQKRIKVEGAETAEGGGQTALPPPKAAAPSASDGSIRR